MSVNVNVSIHTHIHIYINMPVHINTDTHIYTSKFGFFQKHTLQQMCECKESLWETEKTLPEE